MTDRIAVLGAGIMGSCLALSLARHGYDVTLYDREARAMDRASRWNEGKIHLGYLYGADPTLATARHVVTGGLRFGRELSDLLGTDIGALSTQTDDHFLVHPDSVTRPDDLADLFARIDAIVRDHPDAGDYLGDVRAAQTRRLTEDELAGMSEPSRIAAGFAVPERSVDTQAVADLVARALSGEPRVELRLSTGVTASHAIDAADGAWEVSDDQGGTERFDLVVNALWNGRMEIDATAGLPLPESAWSNRYRLALFVTTKRDIAAACRIVTVGPFGDIKCYSPRRFYLSWYPVGLRLDSGDVAPPDPRPFAPDTADEVIRGVRDNLGALLPDVPGILDAAETVTCDGGFVFAQGRGALGDPGSSLHRRDRFGIARLGNYLSVDTGKYSTAPWMARRLADEIAGVQ